MRARTSQGAATALIERGHTSTKLDCVSSSSRFRLSRPFRAPPSAEGSDLPSWLIFVGCPEARFAANFAKLGFHQGFALSVTLPAVIGQQAALDLLYTGRRIDGGEAHAMGLVDRLTDQNHVRDDACALASQIAASAPLAVRSIRETMRVSLAEQARSIMERERGEQERLMRTKDWREGVRAMSQRREAIFAGE